MRCLILSPVIPAPPDDGAKQRILHLARGLARSHDVEVLVLAAVGTSTEALSQLGFPCEVFAHRPTRASAAAHAVVRGSSFYRSLHYSKEFARLLETKLLATRYDVVQCEFAYMAQYRRLVAGQGHETWVLDEHNLEYRLNDTIAAIEGPRIGWLYRAYARRERSRRYREELDAWRAVDHVLTVSEVERDLVQRQRPEVSVTVVPNGVDLTTLTPCRPAPTHDHASGVFVGKMDYRPNVDAVEWFCRDVLPIVREAEPRFTFSIVGGAPTKAVRALGRLSGVSVTGWVEDTRPHLLAATVVVAPLRAGGGTRLKILEALGLERPVVTTPIGCEGLAVAAGTHLLTASSAAEFAAAVIRLVREPKLREAIGRQGRLLVESRYGWDRIAEQLRDFYAEITVGAVSDGT